MNWPDVCSTLEHMSSLPNNWNGQGATALTRQTIDRAKDVIVWLITIGSSPPSRISPSLDGEVVLMWKDEGLGVELSIGEDCLLEFGFSSEKTS